MCPASVYALRVCIDVQGGGLCGRHIYTHSLMPSEARILHQWSLVLDACRGSGVVLLALLAA